MKSLFELETIPLVVNAQGALPIDLILCIVYAVEIPRSIYTLLCVQMYVAQKSTIRRSNPHAACCPSARHVSSAVRRLSRVGRLRPMKVTHERRGSAWTVKRGNGRLWGGPQSAELQGERRRGPSSTANKR